MSRSLSWSSKNWGGVLGGVFRGEGVLSTIIQRIEALQELSGEQQSALNLHHLKWFFSLFSFEEETIQINILLVMNIQYTHPLSNEKTGTT